VHNALKCVHAWKIKHILYIQKKSLVSKWCSAVATPIYIHHHTSNHNFEHSVWDITKNKGMIASPHKTVWKKVWQRGGTVYKYVALHRRIAASWVVVKLGEVCVGGPDTVTVLLKDRDLSWKGVLLGNSLQTALYNWCKVTKHWKTRLLCTTKLRRMLMVRIGRVGSVSLYYFCVDCVLIPSRFCSGIPAYTVL